MKIVKILADMYRKMMMKKDFLINCDRFLWEEIYICGRQHYHGRQVAFSATSTLGNMTTEKRFVGIGDKNSSKVTFSPLVASAEALVVGLWYIYMYNCMYDGMYNCIFAMHHHNRHQPFEIFTRPSSSVTPVTQDHFYSINATQYNAPPRKLRDAIPSQVPHPTCFWTSMAVGEPDQ